jgi:hypothetical protein
MATSLASDFKVYNNEFNAGWWEGISQNLDVFNAASAGAIVLDSELIKGDYGKEAFFEAFANAVTRRDTTSTSTVAGIKLTQDEIISVKCSQKIGPVEYALDAIRKIGKSDQEISFLLGQYLAKAKIQTMVHRGLIAVEAAIESQTTSLSYDASALSGTNTLTTTLLSHALQKLGDMSEQVVAFAMYSKPYFDLVRNQISDKIVNVADRVLYGGVPATLNRPVLVTDDSALIQATSPAYTYSVLGLVKGAVRVTESEEQNIVTQIVTGLENLVVRVQGEFAMNIAVKGFKYGTGGVNPTDATLGSTANWTLAATDVKFGPGVRLVVD